MSEPTKTLKIPTALHQRVRVAAANRNETILTTSEVVIDAGLRAIEKPSKKSK